MTESPVLDAAGRRRSPATIPGFHAGRPPRNKGLRYPADPPTVTEIVAVVQIGGDGLHGRRLRGLVAVLWRAGLRIDEALALHEADLDRRRGSLLVRHGKGGRRREVGMDDWGWQELDPWLTARVTLPIGPLLCIINGRTRGRPWTTSGARAELRRAAARAGVRRRFAPHQLRHAHAVEMAREGRSRRPKRSIAFECGRGVIPGCRSLIGIVTGRVLRDSRADPDSDEPLTDPAPPIAASPFARATYVR